ncbi:hypothetical protein HELRODRAFT_186777 [Helobdella robusta]|uniref:Secretory carrier-associated membrane protein n=1 Tax=Helobdella robusta TaxID=6412 RepID=T1FP34_HELRO|nr:hypothetical protein HELRODRAFT_186777 [Helobdella robusta]ESO08834.1 hypothetical protein HELRODRAFT_186777 [Helobdella robusta]
MSNSFANLDEKNPFEDPAVLAALKIDKGVARHEADITNHINQTVDDAINQAILGPPPPYVSPTLYESSASVDLRRKQEELERKAAELQRREEEMQRNVQLQVRRNNFPPLPSFCPLKPCFFQDISFDIPLQFQHLVKLGYKAWLGYVSILSINVIISLIYLCVSISNDIYNTSGATFGSSIFLLILFLPCSFICWFRPLYNAFRADSSFNFFLFFFVFFMQFCVSIIQSLGMSSFGTVGIISSISMFMHGTAGCIFVGLLMLLVGVAFLVLAAIDLSLLLKVHRIYRSTGASFAKAQQEFTQDILANRTFQQAATSLITTGGTAQNNSCSGNNVNNNLAAEPINRY